MISFVKYSFVVTGLSIPLDYSLSTEKFSVNQIELTEYKSPTLNYDPFEQYKDKKLNELIDRTFFKQE